MINTTEIFDGIKTLIESGFNGKAPVWLLPAIAWIFIAISALTGIIYFFRLIKIFWDECIKPLFRNPECKRTILHRQRFADYIEGEIRRLNALEAWSDYRFTELEAEIEAEGEKNYGDYFGCLGLSIIKTYVGNLHSL